MSRSPTVAFVIPAFNAQEVIADAVASAMAQDTPADEVVVVDDGSTDDTAGIAESAGARVIRQRNGGPAAARNAGIHATTAEWIALLDADDTSYPSRLDRQLQFVGNPDVAAVHGATNDPVPDESARAAGYSGRHAYSPAMPIDFQSMWRRTSVITSTVLLRRAAWQQVGGFDERRDLIGVEDYNLWLRMLHAGLKFVHVGEAVGEYRGTPASLTLNVPRFAMAELANARAVAEVCGLSAAELAEKEFAIYRSNGLDLFHKRDLAAAKPFLREALRRRPLDWQVRLRLWAAMLRFGQAA
jgi:glycosyltransferase involved in cell wall biosynthesis